MNRVKNNHSKLDKEWEQLIFQAKEMGLSLEEVRNFLLKKQLKKKVIV